MARSSKKIVKHENFLRNGDIQVGSEKAFGIVFAVFFAAIAAWPILDGMTPRWWALTLAAIFLAMSFVMPNVLRPLNIVWFKFGMLLHKIINPLTMGLLFYFTVVPMGLVMRLMGKDPLNRKLDPALESYWIERAPHGPEPQSMKNQF
jgi:hypothetical protein